MVSPSHTEGIYPEENNRTFELSDTNIFIKTSSLEIGKLIGSGNNARIYAGFFHDLSIQVAIKQEFKPRDYKARNSSIYEQVQRMIVFDHKNMIKFYGLCENQDDVHLVIMELANPTGSLRKLLNDFKDLPLRVKINMIEQLGNGLKFLHDNEIVHRDFKTENVVLNTYPQNLNDFDLLVLKIIDISTDYGTPSHMAPENFEDRYTKKSDIWSYGCVMWEIMTGIDVKEYFAGASKYDLAFGKRRFDPGFIENEQIRDLVRQCLNEDPTKRPEFDEIFSVLENVYNDKIDDAINDELNDDQENQNIQFDILDFDEINDVELNQNIRFDNLDFDQIQDYDVVNNELIQFDEINGNIFERRGQADNEEIQFDLSYDYQSVPIPDFF